MTTVGRHYALTTSEVLRPAIAALRSTVAVAGRYEVLTSELPNKLASRNVTRSLHQKRWWNAEKWNKINREWLAHTGARISVLKWNPGFVDHDDRYARLRSGPAGGTDVNARTSSRTRNALALRRKALQPSVSPLSR